MIHALRLQARRIASVTRLTPFDTSTSEGRSKERYRRIALAMTSGLVARMLTAFVSLLIVPITLGYLGKDLFGLWSAISSTVVWLSVCDFGISTGLVNALAEAHGRDDREAAARYIFTAGTALTLVASGVAAALLLAAPHIAWDAVFATKAVVPTDIVRLSALSAAGAFVLGMPLSIVTQFYTAYQKAYVTNAFAILGALMTLLAMWLAVGLKANLPGLILATSAAPLIATLANGVVLARREMPWLRITWSLFSLPALRRLTKTSNPAFLLQIAALMVNQSQLLILAHTTGLSTVADYAVIVRLVQVASGVILLTTGAFIPPYREAFERGDHAWVAAGFTRMVRLRMALASIFALMLLSFGNSLVRLWLHRSDVHFSIAIWAALTIFLLSGTWVTAHTDLLTILDRIWVQVVLVLINGIATVALTFALSPAYGILGVMAAVSFVTVCGWTWLLPLISRSILKSGAGREPNWA